MPSIVRFNRYAGGGELVAASAAAVTPGMNPFAAPPPADDTRFDPAVPPGVEIRVVKNFPLVRPSFNGKVGPWLILDTNVTVTLLTASAAEQLGLPAFGRAVFDRSTDPAGSYRLADQFTFGPATITGLVLADCPATGLTGVERELGTRLGGFLGADVFARLVVEADWKAGTVAVHDPRTYWPPPATMWEPVWFNNRTPYISGTVDRSHRAKLQLSTALNYPLKLNNAGDIRDGRLDGRKVEPDRLVTFRGPVDAYAGEVDEFRSFGQTHRRVPARFQVDALSAADRYSGIVGECNPGLLGPAVLVLDYPNRRVGLRRRP